MRAVILFGVTARASLRPNPYLLIAVASWGFNFVAVKEAYKQMSPPTVTLMRYVVMWAGLVLVCLWKRESLKIPREDLWKLLWLGFVSLGVYIFLFMQGMATSGSTEGAILLQMTPIFTALLAAGLKQERFSPGAVIGAIIAFAGTVLVIYGGTTAKHDNSVWGNVVVFVSAFTWAYSVTIMRPLLAKYSPLRVLTLSMPGALPVMFAYGLLPALHTDFTAVDVYGWLMFLHIALISGVVGFLCFYQGVRQIGASGATLYQYFVPPTTMLFAALMTGRVPALLQIAGLVVVLGGVGYATRARYLAQLPVRAPHGVAEGG